MNDITITALVLIAIVAVILLIGLLGYICYVQIIKWLDRRQAHKVQKDIQNEFTNAYNAMLNEAWRCSDQNTRWW